MSETPFYKTRMGQYFYDKTMPDLVKKISQLSERLEILKPGAHPAIAGNDELLLATYGLINAVDEVLEAEILPGSKATQAVFSNLRKRAEIAKKAANLIR